MPWTVAKPAETVKGVSAWFRKSTQNPEHEKVVGVNRRLRCLGHRIKNFSCCGSLPLIPLRAIATMKHSISPLLTWDMLTQVQTIRIVHRCRIVPLLASENLFESLHALAPSPANSKNELLQLAPPMHPTKILQSLPSQWYNHKP